MISRVRTIMPLSLKAPSSSLTISAPWLSRNSRNAMAFLFYQKNGASDTTDTRMPPGARMS